MQWFPTFLAPGTGFMEDNISMEGAGWWFGDDSSTSHLLCTLFLLLLDQLHLRSSGIRSWGLETLASSITHRKEGSPLLMPAVLPGLTPPVFTLLSDPTEKKKSILSYQLKMPSPSAYLVTAVYIILHTIQMCNCPESRVVQKWNIKQFKPKMFQR